MGGNIEEDRYREVDAKTTAKRGVRGLRVRWGDEWRERDLSRLSLCDQCTAATRLEREAM